VSHSAKQDWLTEKAEEMEQEFQARLGAEKAKWDMANITEQPPDALVEKLKKDLNQAIAAKERIEHEMKALHSQKDQERKDAVAEIEEQCEKDYRQFLAEHQDTLNKALISARVQFAQEKASIQVEFNLCPCMSSTSSVHQADMEARHKVELANALKGTTGLHPQDDVSKRNPTNCGLHN
jgi:hypothetical protein